MRVGAEELVSAAAYCSSSVGPDACVEVSVHDLAGELLCTVLVSPLHDVWHLKEMIERCVPRCTKYGHSLLSKGELLLNGDQVLEYLEPHDNQKLALTLLRLSNAERLWLKQACRDAAGACLSEDFESASPEIRASFECASAAVASDGSALRWAAPELQRHRRLARAAVRQTPAALEFVAEEAQDMDLALKAISKDGSLLRWLTPELRANIDVVLIALQQDGTALQFAPLDLRTDPEVVSVAMRQNVRSFEFADPQLQRPIRFRCWYVGVWTWDLFRLHCYLCMVSPFIPFFSLECCLSSSMIYPYSWVVLLVLIVLVHLGVLPRLIGINEGSYSVLCSAVLVLVWCSFNGRISLSRNQTLRFKWLNKYFSPSGAFIS
eukprot:TRINITY_DN37829_c0_g1_i1.p1 TRINITY_DN37829_c0_g1~~TRINITY_DN37829_c0_g1_i1.p1  ORF type:complete len:378 (-),score=58.17 TRINITY_DN37829_c0_g1_i1:266-1399(-)